MIVIIRCLANGKGEKVIERRLFCEISPLTYDISRKKEITIRHIKNVFSKDKIARTHSDEELPNIVKSHSSILLRKLLGVDMKLQENKVTNIKLACEKINGIIIRPDETFSYWCTVGPADKKHNYLEGLVISGKGLMSGYGGGLCHRDDGPAAQDERYRLHRIILGTGNKEVGVDENGGVILAVAG